MALLPEASIDPTVKVPDAVRRAAALAESFYKNPVDPAVTADPAPANPDVIDDPAPADPIVVAEPALADVSDPEITSPPLPPTPLDEPNWQHRYLSMEGRVRQLQGMNQNLMSQMRETTNALMAVRQGQPVPQPEVKRPLITDAERQTYGDELLSVVERKALEVVQPRINKLETENEQLRQRLARGEANDVYTVLAAQIPNWREINRSEEWGNWLSLPDAYSGVLRDTLLKQAFATGDAVRVLNFFRGFLAEHPGQSQPSPVAPRPPAAQAPTRVAAVDLKTLAAPGKVRPAGGGTEVPAEKPVFTNVDIDHFYDRVRRGEYDGREKQKMADEAKIHSAIVEGRVRQVKKSR